MPKIRVEYDDSAEDIVDKVNSVLEDYGIEFLNDGKGHDAYSVYHLVELEEDEEGEEEQPVSTKSFDDRRGGG